MHGRRKTTSMSNAIPRFISYVPLFLGFLAKCLKLSVDIFDMALAGPLSFFFGIFPRLAANAIPAARLCFSEILGDI